MKLAAKIGLPAAQVEIRNANGIDYLLVERYDRKLVPAEPGKLSGGLFGQVDFLNFDTKRLHQEDFCQALAVSPDRKHQSEGGPSLKQCFDLLRDVSSVPAVDLHYFLNAVVFNVLIGNNDAHSKNFSLLYDEGPALVTGLLKSNLYTVVSGKKWESWLNRFSRWIMSLAKTIILTGGSAMTQVGTVFSELLKLVPGYPFDKESFA